MPRPFTDDGCNCETCTKRRENRLSKVFQIPLTPGQYERAKQAAKMRGEPAAVFGRDALMSAVDAALDAEMTTA